MSACPVCGAKIAPGAAECGACGLVFSKWKERQEREKREAAAALAAAEKPEPATKLNPWVLRGAAGAFVFFWIMALSIYLMREIDRSVAKQKAKEAAERLEREQSARGEAARHRESGGPQSSVPAHPMPLPAGGQGSAPALPAPAPAPAPFNPGPRPPGFPDNVPWPGDPVPAQP